MCPNLKYLHMTRRYRSTFTKMHGLAVKWIQDTFAPNVDKNAKNVLFFDNLNCQTKEHFHGVAKELASTLVYALPSEETDKVQPVDQGEGWLKEKTIMGQQLDKYLEKKDKLKNGSPR